MTAATGSAVTSPAARRRSALPWVAALTAVAGITALGGCSAPPGPAAAPTATVTVTAATPAAQPSATATVPAAAAATAQASQAPAAAAPLLGRLAGVFAHGQGFGQVAPARIFNGGDPTGLVTGISWQHWGSPHATGTGTSEYVGAGQSVATGTPQPVTVVAFNLGTCGGTLMYRAVEWYFPQHGQAFSATHYEDICTGGYVPAG
jgi:hypothetical protein